MRPTARTHDGVDQIEDQAAQGCALDQVHLEPLLTRTHRCRTHARARARAHTHLEPLLQRTPTSWILRARPLQMERARVRTDGGEREERSDPCATDGSDGRKRRSVAAPGGAHANKQITQGLQYNARHSQPTANTLAHARTQPTAGSAAARRENSCERRSLLPVAIPIATWQMHG